MAHPQAADRPTARRSTLAAPKGQGQRPFRTEEEETAHGPADYAFWLDDRIVGIVEAKKLTIGPQNVLTQAERYARGLSKSAFDFDGVRCPFLYATNGEVIWFHDVRHELNRSRQVKRLHTQKALQELLERDPEAALEKLQRMPHDHPRLRPYQLEANRAVENAMAERKRNLLVAMATGTGKTFTIVNQIYRLMKAGVAKRVLFLVDRRALAAQAVRAFNSFAAEPNLKFTKAYEVYSSRFQRGDFGEEDRFDPQLLPQGYLTDPQPGHAFVYIATIQRLAVNIPLVKAVLESTATRQDLESLQTVEVEDRALIVAACLGIAREPKTTRVSCTALLRCVGERREMQVRLPLLYLLGQSDSPEAFEGAVELVRPKAVRGGETSVITCAQYEGIRRAR